LKTIKWFIIGILVAAVGFGWFAWTRHIVRDEDGLRVVKKTEGSFQNIYVDTTDWGTLDWLNNKTVRDAVARDQFERTKEAATEAAKDVKEKINEAVEDAQKAVNDAFKKK